MLEDLGIIKVNSHGDITPEDLMGSMRSVIEINEAQGLKKVLVDTTEDTSFPPPLTLLRFGVELANIPTGLRFAMVATSKQEDLMKFLETVGRNRGAEIRMFSTERSAIEWLNKD